MPLSCRGRERRGVDLHVPPGRGGDTILEWFSIDPIPCFAAASGVVGGDLIRDLASHAYYLVIFLAGLQAIPQRYYEAAEIMARGSWRQFLFITLPLLKPTILL